MIHPIRRLLWAREERAQLQNPTVDAWRVQKSSSLPRVPPVNKRPSGPKRTKMAESKEEKKVAGSGALGCSRQTSREQGATGQTGSSKHAPNHATAANPQPLAGHVRVSVAPPSRRPACDAVACWVSGHVLICREREEGAESDQRRPTE